MIPTVPPHPGSTNAAVSVRMSRAKRRDTAPEIRLRRALHAQGLRFRVAFPVPGQRRRSIDIAFTRPKLAVFIDGCFWHGCPRHGTKPRSNSDWWVVKLAANQQRDADTDSVLMGLGWSVIRVWEHESVDEGAAKVLRALGRNSSPVGD